jgi:uncharacterized membrane protein YphA (DoxX/SURF4 family)
VKWFVGVLFIFSGLVKLNDPMGTAIKMEEYFEVFSSDIWSVFHYLVPFAMHFGLFVVILEVLLGSRIAHKLQNKMDGMDTSFADRLLYLSHFLFCTV